ncbi:GntR family transcriptional regulator [Corynebacterium guangdongense]|uniref:DNA-binding transcriptional regulator YhcF (GntR family) n=1 Tax=Corynebacterium guangdongense TaxID=1783348 RepID=A0ABU1ZZZ7_9CORY|nr:GntR family transcriptional regulator [Corynebacterium guangdongense]MDR7330512.1 DNA-binding transcriptional regulator YhcF (GntR family) [Corynebacterium guangdongense]WJZ19067.1 HTH-type transcriptional repressor YtrA [Corynebacterium guangdongense]
MDNANQPLFRQIAALVEDSIVDGVLLAGGRAPSTNELADFHGINPATARKGLNLLTEIGVLEKRRGLGMFVTDSAVDLIRLRRQRAFAGDYLAPLVDEAVRLQLTRDQLHDLLDRVAESRGLYQ